MCSCEIGGRSASVFRLRIIEGSWLDVELFAELKRSLVERETREVGPEVQRVAGAVAVEAAEEVLVNVGREATLVVVRCPIADRARATPLISTRLMRLVANQMKYFGDRNLFANRPIIKPIHERSQFMSQVDS